MPTLQDVAKHAGVSTATVSKVLSNTPYVREETREKVMRAVAELNYVPNIAARALSSGKTHIVAIVFPYIYDPIFKDPVVVRILEGIDEECNLRGYNILLSTPHLQPGTVDDTYYRLLHSGYIEGVIAVDNVPLASVTQLAEQRHLPAVAIGYHTARYSVRSDDYGGARQQMTHILELGHRRIGIISAPEAVNYSVARRMTGLREAAQEQGLNYDALPVCLGDFSTESGMSCAANLLAQHPEITALICLNDRMAFGALQQARLLGRRVPHDLSVIGYDDIPTAAIFAPALTTIDQQTLELGRSAARMLFEVLDNKFPDPVELPARLITRASTQPPADKLSV